MGSGVSASDGDLRLVNIILEDVDHDLDGEVDVVSVQRESNVSGSGVFIGLVKSEKGSLELGDKVFGFGFSDSLTGFFKVLAHACCLFRVIIESTFKNFVKV